MLYECIEQVISKINGLRYQLVNIIYVGPSNKSNKNYT